MSTRFPEENMKHSHMASMILVALAAAAPLVAQQDTTHGKTVSAVASTKGHVTASTHSSSTRHYTQAQLQAMAKISKDSAQTIALAKVANGTVTEAELERHRGTTVWSFDISQPGKSGVEEVLVSAISGRVVWMGHESAAHERAEARADTTKKP
jgi:uncharacterized membrane protein YkoI